jgi:serine/threonine-protein kinase
MDDSGHEPKAGPDEGLKTPQQTGERAGGDSSTQRETVSLGGATGPAGDPGFPELKHWGELEIRERVGFGGFGVVYRAWDPTLEREVALKLLRTHSSRKDLNASIISEARLLARLRHQNVVTVFGVAEHEGYVGMWMDFIHGQNLDRIVHEHGRMGAEEAALIGRDVCRALAAVHGAGLVHRDVKGQNVMREEGGRIVLMDFGLGQEAHKVHIEGGLLVLTGTPQFMAPEVLAGEPATVRSDIYSLGVLLFYLVTATFPVEGRSFEDLITAHREGRRRLVGDLRPDLPETYVQVVARCLSADPAQRFASVGEMLLALGLPLGDSSQRTTVAMPGTAPARRSRRILLLAALSLAVAAVVAVLMYSRLGPPRQVPTPPAETAQLQSIAVLPFENLSSDPENDYFSDGMTDELINQLTKIPNLRVVARTSAFQFKGKSRDTHTIAEQLKVRTLLTGAVQRSGNRVRATVQLVNARDGSVLWSDTYQRNMTDVFAIQDEIARTAVRALRIPLGANAPPQPERRTANVEAYNLYLKGRYEWNKRTTTGLNRALGYFQQALAKDPKYAQAWAGIADANAALGFYGGFRPAEYMLKARKAAEQALRLDDSLAEAWASLGFAQEHYDWDFAKAEQSFQRAIQHNPSDATAHYWYAGLLSNLLRKQDALAEIKRAQDLDPLSPFINAALGSLLYYLGQTEQGVEQLRKTVELEPNVYLAHLVLGGAYMEKRMFPEAEAELHKALELSGNSPLTDAYLGCLEANRGNRDAALRIVAKLTGLREESGLRASSLAMVYAALEDKDQAFSWLDRAYAERDSTMAQLNLLPPFAPLRSDPRFTALVAKVGLPAPR